MKILYCVQLTGNGHVTRANELILVQKGELMFYYGNQTLRN